MYKDAALSSVALISYVALLVKGRFYGFNNSGSWDRHLGLGIRNSSQYPKIVSKYGPSHVALSVNKNSIGCQVAC